MKPSDERKLLQDFAALHDQVARLADRVSAISAIVAGSQGQDDIGKALEAPDQAKTPESDILEKDKPEKEPKPNKAKGKSAKPKAKKG